MEATGLRIIDVDGRESWTLELRGMLDAPLKVNIAGGGVVGRLRDRVLRSSPYLVEDLNRVQVVTVSGFVLRVK